MSNQSDDITEIYEWCFHGFVYKNKDKMHVTKSITINKIIIKYYVPREVAR